MNGTGKIVLSIKLSPEDEERLTKRAINEGFDSLEKFIEFYFINILKAQEILPENSSKESL